MQKSQTGFSGSFPKPLLWLLDLKFILLVAQGNDSEVVQKLWIEEPTTHPDFCIVKPYCLPPMTMQEAATNDDAGSPQNLTRVSMHVLHMRLDCDVKTVDAGILHLHWWQLQRLGQRLLPWRQQRRAWRSQPRNSAIGLRWKRLACRACHRSLVVRPLCLE